MIFIHQLKLGKLKDGFYYIGNGEITTIAMLKNKDRSFYTWDSCIAKTLSDTSEVLAPVPTYKELQSLEADRLAKNEGAEIVAELKQENARLKGLLKECLPIVSAEVMTWQIRGGEESHQRGKELLTKIEEALK